jgi:hypothetical protein
MKYVLSFLQVLISAGNNSYRQMDRISEKLILSEYILNYHSQSWRRFIVRPNNLRNKLEPCNIKAEKENWFQHLSHDSSKQKADLL